MSTKKPPADTAATTDTKVTPLEAKIIWEMMAEPSIEKVAAHFAAEGRPLNNRTLQYWTHHQWKSGEDDFGDTLVDLILATGLNTSLKPKEIDAKLNGLLRIMPDAKMLRANYRSVMAASIKSALAIARHSDAMAQKTPQAMGAGIKNSAEAIPKAIEGMQRLELVDQRLTQQSGGEQSNEDAGEDMGPDLASAVGAYSREANRLQ